MNGGLDTDGGVAHGALLRTFTEAVMRGDPATTERQRLCAVLPADGFVDVAAVIGAFNTVDRIADATGIPLDPAMATISQEVRDRLGLARFASAANTPDD